MPEKDIIKFMYRFIELFGDFLKKIADVEKETGASTSDMENFSKPEKLFEFFRESPPEKIGLFMKFMLEAAPLFSKVQNPLIISSDEKIEIYTQIQELLQKYSDIIK